LTCHLDDQGCHGGTMNPSVYAHIVCMIILSAFVVRLSFARATTVDTSALLAGILVSASALAHRVSGAQPTFAQPIASCLLSLRRERTARTAAQLTPATGLGGRHRLGRAAAKLLRRARDRHVLPFRTPALERGESGWAGLVASGSGQPQWTWQHRLVARVAYDFFAAGWTSLLLRRLKQVRRGWTELQVTQRARGERLGLGLVLGWGRGHGLSARSLAAWVGTGAPFLHAARAREHPRMCQSLPQTLTLTRPDGAAHGPAYAPRLHHGLYRIADPPRRVCRGHHVPVKPQWFARSD